jgi:HAD superfamily hydrolase (TIGR01509 family)
VAKDTLEFVFKKKLTNEEIAGYLDEKETIYRAVYRNFIEPLPGLLKLLDSLKRSNIKIGLATSAPPGNVDFTFSFIPVRSYFEVILDGNSITRGKPDPEVYSRTIGMLGLKPAECVIFEDSLPGIKAGLASGAHVVGVATTHNMDELREVSRVITDFSEVDIPFLHQVIGLP